MTEKKTGSIVYQPIGLIRTAYKAGGFTPDQPLLREDGESVVEVFPEFRAALADLASFKYVMLIYHLHEASRPSPDKVAPPWAQGKEVGLFASRSPNRPNPIGLSIVRVKKIEDGQIFTLPLDIHDGTPLIDVKPYIAYLDAKPDAGDGWIASLPDHHHLLAHLTGAEHHHDHNDSKEHHHKHKP
jgi:tRNA (adenine37-N6)-methyltransferase